MTKPGFSTYKHLCLPVVILFSACSFSACATQNNVRAYQAKSCAELEIFSRQQFLNLRPDVFGSFNKNDPVNDVLLTLFQSDEKNRKTAIRRNYEQQNCSQ